MSARYRPTYSEAERLGSELAADHIATEIARMGRRKARTFYEGSNGRDRIPYKLEMRRRKHGDLDTYARFVRLVRSGGDPRAVIAEQISDWRSNGAPSTSDEQVSPNRFDDIDREFLAYQKGSIGTNLGEAIQFFYNAHAYAHEVVEQLGGLSERNRERIRAWVVRNFPKSREVVKSVFGGYTGLVRKSGSVVVASQEEGDADISQLFEDNEHAGFFEEEKCPN